MRWAVAMLLLVGCDREQQVPIDPFANAACESPADGGVPPPTLCRDGTWSWIGAAPEESTTRSSSVWGRSAGDAWFVFQGPINGPLRSAIDHWDGARWTREWWSTNWQLDEETPNDLYGIWGAADDDLWVVGNQGTILHSTGAGCWFHVASGTTAKLTAIAGRNRNDVVAVGVGGAAVHWDGDHWSAVESGATGDFNAIVAGGSFLWATTDVGEILRWDGTAFRRDKAMDVPLTGIWAASDTDAWAVGRMIFHWDGKTWAPHEAANASCTTTNSGVWGTGPNDVWFASCYFGQGGHWNGEIVTRSDALGGRLVDGWSYDTNSAYHYEDVRWKRVFSDEDLTDIAVVGSDEAWTVSHEGGIFHYDGTGWTESYRAPNSLWSVTATGGHVWAAGNGGVLYNSAGNAWTPLGLLDSRVDDVWASAPDDVYALSDSVLRHWDGAQWTVANTLPGSSRVWGTGRGDVWVVGDGETAVHFDGQNWQGVPFISGNHGFALDLWGTAANDVWSVVFAAAPGGHAIGHWDGTVWSVVSPKLGGASAIRASGAGDIWLIPDLDTISHWDGQDLACSANWYQALRKLGGTTDDLWAVGSYGTVLRRRR